LPDLAQQSLRIATLGLQLQRSGARSLVRARVRKLDQKLGISPAILEPEAILPVLGKVSSLATDPAHQAADDRRMEEAVLQSQRKRDSLLLPSVEPALDGLESGQQVRRDIPLLSLACLSAGEAHTAALHEA